MINGELQTTFDRINQGVAFGSDTVVVSNTFSYAAGNYAVAQAAPVAENRTVFQYTHPEGPPWAFINVQPTGPTFPIS